jgi:hypothetical protein
VLVLLRVNKTKKGAPREIAVVTRIIHGRQPCW